MTSEQLAKTIRKQAIKMTHTSGASHIGSILSVADVIAVLYSNILKIYPKDPYNDLRDRLVLSKGHAGVAVYVALAEKGFFPKSWLDTYYKDNSLLSGHVSHKGIPGVEISTGSLGHGVAMATGMALGAKLDNKKHHIYTIVGDGECEEGIVWETALFASFQELDNLTVIVDCNKMQALGFCKEQIGFVNLPNKWREFGFNVLECDGHNHTQIKEALSYQSLQKPTCIIAHTIKGKGISFMENNLLWHYRDPQGEWYEKAMNELEEEQ